MSHSYHETQKQVKIEEVGISKKGFIRQVLVDSACRACFHGGIFLSFFLGTAWMMYPRPK